MGTQQHGYPHFIKACEIVRSGRLGRISLVESWNYANRGQRVGRPADAEPPPGLHWDRWRGALRAVQPGTCRIAHGLVPCHAKEPLEIEKNARWWRDGKPGNEVDGSWQRQFADCVRQGQRMPIEMEESHRATVCCHLADIAYRTRSRVVWDGETETIPGNLAAAAMLDCGHRKGYELPTV